MKFYLVNALFLPQKRDGQIVQGLEDGWGYPISGIHRPDWDTLVGLYNDSTQDAICRWTLWNERTGQKVIWPSGRDYEELLLKAGFSWACTFLPGNPWPETPVDWMGHGEIECFFDGPIGRAPSTDIYAWAMLGGSNWDHTAHSCATPIVRDPPLDCSLAKNRWIVPYVIPYFADANHPGRDRYTTGISLQNFEDFDIEIQVVYRVNQLYPRAGESWSWKHKIGAHEGIRYNLIEPLSAAGYPKYTNSEGHLIVTSDRLAHIEGHAIPATADFMLAASEPFQ